MHTMQSRRDFLTTLSAAGAAGVIGSRSSLADEPPPETTTLRLARRPIICIAPEYISEDLLRAEAFTDIRRTPDPPVDAVARGEIDFSLDTAPWVVSQVGVRTLGGSAHLLLALMAAHVGLDPHEDIDWVPRPAGRFIELFAAGELDAVLGFPPEPQELRARKVGRVILNMATDKPWSQYFCCIVYGNRQFVRAHPIATKRYLRAILKAADLCATQPARAAQRLVDGGFPERYDYALPDADGASVRAMARVRPGGLDAVLRAPGSTRRT